MNNFKQVINKLWTSHEQAMNKPWTNCVEVRRSRSQVRRIVFKAIWHYTGSRDANSRIQYDPYMVQMAAMTDIYYFNIQLMRR